MHPCPRRALAALLAALLFAPAAARAAVPATMTVQGELADPDGVPYEGDTALVFTLYDGPGPGAATLWSEAQVTPLVAGRFVTRLGVTVPLPAGALAAHPTAHLGLAVDPDGVVGRVPLSSLAFAFQAARADEADTLEGLTADAFARADVACPAGQAMGGVDAAGQPVCHPDADATYDGADFTLADQACAAGQVALGVDAVGALACVAEADTVYTSAAFAPSDQACPAGQLARGFDASGALLCALDANTTYTGATFGRSGAACPAGQLLRGFDASGALVCAADANTTYSGTQFALSSQSCPAGQVVRGISASGTLTCVADADTNTTYSGASFGLSNQACAANRVATGFTAAGALGCQDVSAWDRDASNDLTTATAFAGDLTGTYGALALPNASIAASDLATAYVTKANGTVSGTVSTSCLRPWRSGTLALGACGALPTGITQATDLNDSLAMAAASDPAVADDETLFFTSHDDCASDEGFFLGTGATGQSATAWRGLRVQGNGAAYLSGTLTANAGQLYPSDLAEHVPSDGRLEPGDVVIALSLDRADFSRSRFGRSARAYDPRVVGVVSDTVALAMGPAEGRAPVALKGLVRVKVDARPRPIAPGDLLVASDTPGRAMAAGELVRGAVIGKALEPLHADLGVILMLVMPR